MIGVGSLAFTDGWAVAGAALFSGRAGLFLRVVAGCVLYVVVAAMLRRTLAPAARTWGQVAVSLALLTVLTTPLLTTVLVAYGLAFYALVEHAPPGAARRVAIVAAVAVQVIAPIFWLPMLPGYAGITRELVAFATNATQLRCWAYAWDRAAARDAPRPALRDYALYMVFFPAFISGPLVSYGEFQVGRGDTYWSEASSRRAIDTLRLEWRALMRVPIGLVAALAALSFVPTVSPQGYTAATRGTLAAWEHAVAVYFAVYFGFTAWSETAIGCARAAGVVLPENFDHAHRSYGIADFWRRWNIRLGWWMRTYIYLPLGGSRRRLWRNTAAVFLATAVYHHIGGFKLLGPALMTSPTFYLGWLGWAAINTVGTLATRRWQRPDTLGPRAIAVMVATFLVSSVALQTAFLPPGMSWRTLATIYRHLIGFG
ncbi:MAG: MBOAT family O-acyltransferase [Candidatus Binatia bacterium]